MVCRWVADADDPQKEIALSGKGDMKVRGVRVVQYITDPLPSTYDYGPAEV